VNNGTMCSAPPAQCAESARLRGGRFPAPRVRANEAIHPLQCAAGIRRAAALAARRPLTRALTLRTLL